MKLFLTSSFAGVASLFQEKIGFLVREKKVLFIENAADVYDGDAQWGDKPWVQSDREAFKKMGFEVVSFDLRTVLQEDFEKQLQNFSVIHFCGGSELYLISILKEKGFDKPLNRYVSEERIIYSGSSAGSMIASVDLSLSALDSDETERVKKMKDFKGLGWVNFFIAPHANMKEFISGNKRIAGALPNYPYPVIFLSDTQALFVEGKNIEMLIAK